MALEKIGALWLKDGKKGKFMSGVLRGEDVLIFKNNNKKSAKHPDYEVFITADEGDRQLPPDPVSPELVGDDIPF